MRIIMLALLARGARALSAVPAAARRLQKIKELESKHALLVESGAKPAVIRNARKELGRLKRTPPPVDGVESAVATFYGFFPVEEPSAVVQRLRAALEEAKGSNEASDKAAREQASRRRWCHPSRSHVTT